MSSYNTTFYFKDKKCLPLCVVLFFIGHLNFFLSKTSRNANCMIQFKLSAQNSRVFSITHENSTTIELSKTGETLNLRPRRPGSQGNARKRVNAANILQDQV